MSYDNINPDHYKQGDKEVWQMMIACFGEEAYINFCRLNAFKYRMRAGKKPTSDASEDIKKAEWYEKKMDELTRLEKKHLGDHACLYFANHLAELAKSIPCK